MELSLVALGGCTSTDGDFDNFVVKSFIAAAKNIGIARDRGPFPPAPSGNYFL